MPDPAASMSGNGSDYWPADTKSETSGPTVSHPVTQLCPPEGLKHYHQYILGLCSWSPSDVVLPISSWQPLYKAELGNQLDGGLATPTSWLTVVSLPQWKGPHSPHRGAPLEHIVLVTRGEYAVDTNKMSITYKRPLFQDWEM